VTLKQTIYLSLAVVAVVIGIHQIVVAEVPTVSEAIAANYWLFMLALVFLILLRYDKKKHKQ
jgi:hypothetical protein